MSAAVFLVSGALAVFTISAGISDFICYFFYKGGAR